jgi:hypothetical protein
MSETSKQRASIMMMHAFKRVEQGHTSTKGKLKRFFTHKVSQKLRTTSTSEYVAMGVGLTVTAGVLIASAVLTAGIAPAILAGIAAGTYALKKLITSIGNETNRLNRNWLNKYQKAVSASTTNWANTLGVESKDAMRRAIDHYNTTRDIIERELRQRSKEEIVTCHEAINKALAAARFIHHSDKTRNYLLPCIDFCIFMLCSYKSMSDKWNAKYTALEGALEQWFDYHETTLIGHCNKDSGEICYGPAPGSRGSLKLRKPHPSSGTIGTSNVTTSTGTTMDGDSVDLTDMIRSLMEGSVESIEKVMRRNDGKPAPTYNYKSVMPSTRLDERFFGFSQGNQKRFTKLIDDVFGKADHPGYLSKVGRKLSHSVTRRTTSEIGLALFSEVLDVSSVATPFIPNLDIGKVLSVMIKGGTLIRTGITGTTKATELFGGIVSFKSNEKAAIASGLLNWQEVDKVTESAVKSAGVKVEELIVKTGTHFNNAFNACKAIEDLGGCSITDCRQAWEYCKAIAEVIHEFSKMEKYLMMTLSLVNFLGDETIVWADAEPEIWYNMEEEVAEWVMDPDNHEACREAGSHCYGPKVTGWSTGILHRRHGVTRDPTAPHKPL